MSEYYIYIHTLSIIVNTCCDLGIRDLCHALNHRHLPSRKVALDLRRTAVVDGFFFESSESSGSREVADGLAVDGYDGFLKYPQIMYFHGVFHEKNHLFLGYPPHLWKPRYERRHKTTYDRKAFMATSVDMNCNCLSCRDRVNIDKLT